MVGVGHDALTNRGRGNVRHVPNNKSRREMFVDMKTNIQTGDGFIYRVRTNKALTNRGLKE